jgi:hypothetical protein
MIYNFVPINSNIKLKNNPRPNNVKPGLINPEYFSYYLAGFFSLILIKHTSKMESKPLRLALFSNVFLYINSNDLLNADTCMYINLSMKTECGKQVASSLRLSFQAGGSTIHRIGFIC